MSERPKKEQFTTLQEYLEVDNKWLEESKTDLEIKLLSLNHTLLEERNKIVRQEELIKSYEVIFKSKKRMLEYLTTGTEVFLAPNYKEKARIFAIVITHSNMFYKIGRWINGNYIYCNVPADEVAEEPPLSLGG